MSEMVFSWAENANGRMVHVDDVPRGLACKCMCPHCHEILQARHGEVREHGFAHNSKTRRANLKICYRVIMYKLAEQIIKEEMKIHAPSYYGIYPEHDIEFFEVTVDGRYDRIDKQPDVIAKTPSGEVFLIEFTFIDKVQHKEKIDYKSLNCLEIDLSHQNLESLKDFLLQSNSDKLWVNCQGYFNNIESKYSQCDKSVRVVNEIECSKCPFNDICCGVRSKGHSAPITIENSGQSYRVCKVEEYNKLMTQREEDIERTKREEERLQVERDEAMRSASSIRLLEEQQLLEEIESAKLLPANRTCFMCKSNLDWMCRGNNGYAHCGPYISMCVPKNTPPDTAKTCCGFKAKTKL